MKSALVLVVTFVLHLANGDGACFDVDSDACKMMEQNKPDLCDSSIGNTACPRYCGKCPLECFSCPDIVQDISQCNTAVTCGFNETCYTMEIFDFDRSHGVMGGCIAKALCVPHGGQAQLFGRSSSSVQTKCCDTDRCNGLSTTTTSPIIPTTTRHTTHAHETTTQHHSYCTDNTGNTICHFPNYACAHTPYKCRKTCGLCCKIIIDKY